MELENLIREIISDPVHQKQMQLAQEMFHNAFGSENFLTNLLLTLPMGITVFRSIFRRELKSAMEEQGLEIKEVMDEVLKHRRQEPRQTFMQKNWPGIISAAIVAPVYASIIYSKLEPHITKHEKFDPLGLIWYGLAAASTYFAYPFFKLMASAFEPGKIKGNLNYLAAALLDKPLIRKASLKFYENYAELSDTNLAHRALARVYFRFGRPEDAMNQLYIAMEKKKSGRSKFEEILDEENIAELRDLYAIYHPLLERKANNYFFCSLVAEDLGLNKLSVEFAEEAIEFTKKPSPEAHLFKSALHERAGQYREHTEELEKALSLIITDKTLLSEGLNQIESHSVFELTNSPLLRHSFVFKKTERKKLLREVEMTRNFEKMVYALNLPEKGMTSASFVDFVELQEQETYAAFRHEKGRTLYDSDQSYVMPAAYFLGFFHSIMPISGADRNYTDYSFISFKERVDKSLMPKNLKEKILGNIEFCFSGAEQLCLVKNKDSHQHNLIITDDKRIVMIDIEDKGLTDPASDLAKLIFQTKHHNMSLLSPAVHSYLESFNEWSAYSENDQQIQVSDEEMESYVLRRVPLKAISHYCFAEEVSRNMPKTPTPEIMNRAAEFLRKGRSSCVHLGSNGLKNKDAEQAKFLMDAIDKLLREIAPASAGYDLGL